MKNNRLTAAEIEEIKMKIRKQINTEQHNSEDTRVRLENPNSRTIRKHHRTSKTGKLSN